MFYVLKSCVCCSRQKIELPSMENVQTIPPPYVVRTVLIYSRHAGPMQFNPSEALSVSHCSVCGIVKAPICFILWWSSFLFLFQKMLQSPYFFFDVVYLHNGMEEQGDETSWRVSVFFSFFKDNITFSYFLNVCLNVYCEISEVRIYIQNLQDGWTGNKNPE